MALDCYDFDCGQPRHFPAGDYYRQRETAVGSQELDIMRLLWRCWLIFKHRKPGDWTDEDVDFSAWLINDPIDDTALNQWIRILWQQQAA